MPAGASFGLHAALLIRARPATRIATATRCGNTSLAPRSAPWRRVQQVRPNSSFGPRVGKAVEPRAEWDGSAEQKQEDETVKAVEEKEKLPEPQTKSVVKLDPNQDQEPPPRDDEPQKHELDPRSQSDNAEPSKEDTSQQGTPEGSTSPDQGTPRQAKDDAAAAPTTQSCGPLEAVLHMEPPQKVARQHPAMSPPPYVHHFDSYSLVKQLQDGGYSPDQAIEAMKGIRALLAQNLDVAQESLVSKSDVENVGFPLPPALHVVDGCANCMRWCRRRISSEPRARSSARRSRTTAGCRTSRSGSRGRCCSTRWTS
jgi:hypothetical protein